MDRKLVMCLAGKNLPTRIRELLSERGLYKDWNQECEILVVKLAEEQDFKVAAREISQAVYRFLKDYGFNKPKSSTWTSKEWITDTRALILWIEDQEEEEETTKTNK